jgi:predicted GNAT superfamily acetyltransferase
VSDVQIRPLASIEDYRACVALQEETWGVGFSERVSPAILKVAQILGGVSSGAFTDDGRPELRDTGLGRRLKAYQRREVVSRGVEKMLWTFDPLRSRNAHLNITRLGAVVREYAVDMYGDTDSPLHRGIGTDRFIALWLLTSSRVEDRVGAIEAGSIRLPTTPDPTAPLALAADESRPWPRPGDPLLSLGNDAVRVAIPADIGPLMEDDPSLARAWREATRAAFVHYLGRGFEVREFGRGTTVSTYELGLIKEHGS